jgi:hypothetical protein
MKAEAEAVTVSDGNADDGGSGGNEDNSSNRDGGCIDKNNQQSIKSG